MTNDIRVCIVLDDRMRRTIFHKEVQNIIDAEFEISLVLIDNTYEPPSESLYDYSLVTKLNKLKKKLWRREFGVILEVERYVTHQFFPEKTAVDELNTLKNRDDIFETVPELNESDVVAFEPQQVTSHRYDFPENVIERISDQCDVVILIGFSKILTGNILKATEYGVLNCHPSDITKYRGRPHGFFQWINDEDEIGMTLQQLSNELDGGRIILQEHANITEAKSWDHVQLAAKQLRGDMIARGLKKLQDSEFEPKDPSLGVLTRSKEKHKLPHVFKCLKKNLCGRWFM